MGGIRYFILERVNKVREAYGRSPLCIHEENSDAAQRHAQYVLEEMLKWGRHRFNEIGHTNPFYHGEYFAENIGLSEGNVLLEGHANSIINQFCNERGEGSHFGNILNSWHYMGSDVAYDKSSGLVVLVQRFAE